MAADDSCWGNGFRCQECCTREWVYVTAMSGVGVEKRSCWTEEGNYSESTLGGLGAGGRFVPKVSADGGVVNSGQDIHFDYDGTVEDDQLTGTELTASPRFSRPGEADKSSAMTVSCCAARSTNSFIL